MAEIQVVTVPVDFINAQFSALTQKIDEMKAAIVNQPAAEARDSWLSANAFRIANHIGQPKLERLVAQKKVERMDFGGRSGLRYRWKR